MPYRIDIPRGSESVFERLVDLGALDASLDTDGGVAAIMPDVVTPRQVAGEIGDGPIAISPAVGRDDESIWVLQPQTRQIGRIWIVGADSAATGNAVRLVDTPAFGTGLHPSTVLCLEALQDIADLEMPDALLDVGTGSGILAIAALRLGVRRAIGIDTDAAAIRAAAQNATLNGVEDRLQLALGGPVCITGSWPVVLANVLAAPLIEMAPTLVQRVAHRGQLVLSGIGAGLEEDVARAYLRLGMRRSHQTARAGWVSMTLRASW